MVYGFFLSCSLQIRTNGEEKPKTMYFITAFLDRKKKSYICIAYIWQEV